MTDQPAGGRDGDGFVLVVEDDGPTRQLLATILEEEGLPCVVAATGHEALTYTSDNPPALVVLDMHLPNLQGEAVATALRMQFGRSLPILAISASNERGAAARAGAYDFLSKPFDIRELVAKVRRGLALAPAAAAPEAGPSPRARVRAAAARQRATFEEHRARKREPTAETPKGGAAQG